MKYPAHVYAKALAESAMLPGVDPELMRRNFLELLRRSGDEAHLQKIVEEAERFLREKDGTKRIVVRLARKQSGPVRELVHHLAGPNDVVDEEIDPTLIAGMKVIVNDAQEFDGSLKAKLDAMFGTI